MTRNHWLIPQQEVTRNPRPISNFRNTAPATAREDSNTAKMISSHNEDLRNRRRLCGPDLSGLPCPAGPLGRADRDRSGPSQVNKPGQAADIRKRLGSPPLQTPGREASCILDLRPYSRIGSLFHLRGHPRGQAAARTSPWSSPPAGLWVDP